MLSPLEIDIRKHLKHNVIVNLSDGVFFGLAVGFGSFTTILPLFVSQMTDSAILIGLIPAIHSMGWQLPQFFMAGKVARLRQFKPMVLRNTIQERLPFLGLALAAWFLPVIGKPLALALTFQMLVWQGLGGGITANAWQSMIAKIIPPDWRGTFYGTQAALANLMIGTSAIAAGYLLTWQDFPFNFTLTFLFTTILMAVSWIFLALTREPIDRDKEIPDQPPSIWSGARDILKRDTNFNWFLAVRVFSQFGIMGFSFYILYALRQFDMDTVTAGFFTATFTAAQTAANLGMGWVGDKIGHRAMLILGAISGLGSIIIALFAPSIVWFYLVFALAGMSIVSIWTTAMAMTVDFGKESERPLYIGLSNTLIAPATFAAPILGGLIADTWGYAPMFITSAFFGVITILILLIFVREPRVIKDISTP
jgi:MFS family permease